MTLALLALIPERMNSAPVVTPVNLAKTPVDLANRKVAGNPKATVANVSTVLF